VRIINANPGMGAAMTEEEAKGFMIGHTIIHIGTVDKKGEPNVVPTGYHFDKESNEIYIPTQKGSKKVENLGKKNIISFCVDDTNPPYKGVRGKGKVKIHEDTGQNRNIAKKLLLWSPFRNLSCSRRHPPLVKMIFMYLTFFEEYQIQSID
jgi:general stress protein 26